MSPSVSGARAHWGQAPQGLGRCGRQLGILALVDFAYELVRGIADGQRAVAIAHGQQVIEFERSTHTFFEPSLQALFLPAHWLIDFANQVYLNSQFTITLGFLSGSTSSATSPITSCATCSWSRWGWR